MIFEYQQQKTFTNAIDVIDAGNTCLKCTSVDNYVYYIIIKTVYGKLHILKVGPLIEDTEVLLDGFAVTYKKYDYKEPTIQKEVNMIINDPKKRINEVEEIPTFEALSKCPNIAQLFETVD